MKRDEGSRALRIQVLIGFMCLALVVYFVLLGRAGVILVTSGRPAAIGLGVAVFLLKAASVEDLVSNADAALYKAKRGGKDRVESYG